jgi:glycerophosphoryl diester phosphodiesterase
MKIRNLLITIVVLPVAIHSFAQCPPVKVNFDSCLYTPVGHRGESSIYPENTLLSIEAAFKRGVKYTEVDVSLTKDNQYVLFHDVKSVYRTTNGTGDLTDYTLAELLQLDAGAWRGDQFTGTRIPTLVDALRLAEKYKAHLYLDIKASDFNALKNAFTESGVAPNRLAPSIESIAQAQKFRALFPESPWVWFGGGAFPDNVDDSSFYTQCVQLGCIAFEVSESNITDSNWEVFRDYVHNAGAMVWAYTINDNSLLSQYVLAGVDGMESDRPWESGTFICNGTSGNSGYDSVTNGNWLFKGNLQSTYIGSQLRTWNYKTPRADQIPLFASCSVFSIPLINGQNKVVMKLPAQDSANALLCLPNSRIERNGIEEATYSIVMDVLRPASSAGKWIAVFQTNTRNLNDADFFIDPAGGVGISESYHGNIAPDTWYRLGITVDGINGIMKKYINGALVGTTSLPAGGRWDIWNSSRAGDDQGFFLFADDNGETSDMYISALQTRNYVLTDADMSRLGAVNASGIAMSNADAWHANLDVAYTDSTIMDYENRTYYFVVPYNAPDSALLSFDLYGNARASISNNKKINIKSGYYTWLVTSQDSTQIREWKACIRKTEQLTGITEKEIWALGPVYPNPAQQHITISNLPAETCTYTISNITGQTMQQGKISNDLVDVNTLPNGVYFLRVQHHDRQATAKFVVIR